MPRNEIVLEAVNQLCLEHGVSAVVQALAHYCRDWGEDVLAGIDAASAEAVKLADQLEALVPTSDKMVD